MNKKRPEAESEPLSVLVVVPTRNSARTLERCLRSIRDQAHPCAVAVVDNFSTDHTPQIARNLADFVVVAGPERSTQRNLGAAAVRTDVVGFVDSDMVLDPGLVGEIVEMVHHGAGAVVVPERTIGVGFWTRVRAFERSMYLGSSGVEAARFFRRDVFEATGGFDESLDAGEDWDLAIRARALGQVSRTRLGIDHDEGVVRFVSACRKKASYAAGISRFVGKHGATGLRSFDRPYLRRPWMLLSRGPMLGAGLVMLKAGELSFVTAALARRWVRDQSAIVGRVLARSGVLTYRDDVTGERDLPVPDRYRWAIEWAELRRGSRVLDVGCFTGELLALAADEVGSASCTGIDIPGPWLEDASSRHPELSFLPVEKLESAAMTEVGRFDTVFLLETIEHLPRGTEAAVLANIARALAPGGHLLCSAPASGALALGDPAWLLTGHRHYRAGRLAKLAAAAGLEVVEVAYSGNIWALIDMNLFYVQKHILRRPYRPSRFVHERADTGLYSRRRITRLNVWVKLRV